MLPTIKIGIYVVDRKLWGKFNLKNSIIGYLIQNPGGWLQFKMIFQKMSFARTYMNMKSTVEYKIRTIPIPKLPITDIRSGV